MRQRFASRKGVFFLTFTSYALMHAIRKSFSAIKGEMSEEIWMRSAFFTSDQQAQMYGVMDTMFMGAYAIGLYVFGILGDTMDLRVLITGGMISSSIIVWTFGIVAFAGMRSLTLYTALWGVNGLIQSSGWPTNVAVMGHWFPKNERGAILGLWGGCGSFGNIVGSVLVALMFRLFDATIAWKVSLLVVAGLVAIQAVVIFAWLVPDPRMISGTYQPANGNIQGEDHHLSPHRLNDLDSESDSELGPGSNRYRNRQSRMPTTPTNADELSKSDSKQSSSQGISFLQAWLIPGVIPYSLSYACLKSVNYALFFWLPFYLTVSLGMDNAQADLVSSIFDVGQMIGGFLGGYVSDKLGVRSPVLVVMLLLSCITLQYFQDASYNTMAVLLLASGILIGGPSNLIATAIAADLGTHESLKGNAAALSTVTGIVDGTGSIGAAVMQYVVGYLANCHSEPAGCDLEFNPHCREICSWDPVFNLLQTGTVLACACVSRLLYNEAVEVYTQFRQQSQLPQKVKKQSHKSHETSV